MQQVTRETTAVEAKEMLTRVGAVIQRRISTTAALYKAGERYIRVDTLGSGRVRLTVTGGNCNC